MTPLRSSGGGLAQERRKPVDVIAAAVTLRGAEVGAKYTVCVQINFEENHCSACIPCYEYE